MVVLLALTPNFHPGHLVALLESYSGSGFNTQDDPEVHQLTQRIIQDAEHRFNQAAGIMSGGLFLPHTPMRAVDQVLTYAPRLVIANDLQQEHLASEFNISFLDRIYTSFIINADIRIELMDILDTLGENPSNGETFVAIHYGMPGILTMI